MAPPRRALRRPGLDSVAFDGTDQATTGSQGTNFSTLPKESQDSEKHGVSLGTNKSAHTTQRTAPRKRRRAAKSDNGSPSKRLKKSHRSARERPPTISSTSLPTAPQKACFLSLPTELQQEILSHGSARDTARCRRVCKGLERFILGSTSYFIREHTGRELSPLRVTVDEFNNLRPPTNADSLMEAMHVWTKRRGRFSNSYVSVGSMMKLMAHFLVKKDPEENIVGTKSTAYQWALIAHGVASILLCPPEELDIDRHASYFAGTGLLDDNELDKLLKYTTQPQLQTANHRLGGRLWPQETMEYMTFPGTWKLTPLLRYPSTYGLEISSLRNADFPFDNDSMDWWTRYLEEPDSPGLVWQPGLGNEHVIRYLGLPTLPNTVSCYYVKDSWARYQIDKLVGQLGGASKRQQSNVTVAPLLRAAILESVVYF